MINPLCYCKYTHLYGGSNSVILWSRKCEALRLPEFVLDNFSGDSLSASPLRALLFCLTNGCVTARLPYCSFSWQTNKGGVMVEKRKLTRTGSQPTPSRLLLVRLFERVKFVPQDAILSHLLFARYKPDPIILTACPQTTPSGRLSTN